MAITQADVARHAGVSRALVSLVMRDSPSVSPARREAVLQAARELGYRPNAHAARLASHRSKVLGLVITELENPIFAEVMFVAEREAARLGYDILPTLGRDAAKEHEAVNRLLGHRVDGIVLLGSRLDPDEVRSLSLQIPLVVTGRTIDGVDSVAVDGTLGARLVVDHLASLGHRRIAHIDGGKSAGTTNRRDGYLEAMAAHGLHRQTRVVPGGPAEADGIAATEEMLSEQQAPTAIFAFNDMCAAGALSVARHHAIDVPNDLALVGFDDTSISALRCIDLTTVSQPREELGTGSVSALFERIADPSRLARSTLVAPSLVVRSTTELPKDEFSVQSRQRDTLTA
jgi:DNA-binding LacI/PurR family transcriptional regulator